MTAEEKLKQIEKLCNEQIKTLEEESNKFFSNTLPAIVVRETSTGFANISGKIGAYMNILKIIEEE